MEVMTARIKAKVNVDFVVVYILEKSRDEESIRGVAEEKNMWQGRWAGERALRAP